MATLETAASALKYAAAASEKDGDIRRAYLYFEGKKVRGRPRLPSSASVSVMAPKIQVDSHCVQLKREGKTIYASSRRGPHAATQAESDLQVLREANPVGNIARSALATLETAASVIRTKEARATLVEGTPKSGQPAYGSNAEVSTVCLRKKRRGKDCLPTEGTPR